MLTLYHVTNTYFASDIIRKGLRPRIGDNSRFAGEQRPAVYLCALDDVAGWSIMLDADIVFEVTGLEEDDLQITDFSCGREYAYFKPIPVNQVNIYTGYISVASGMIKLCKNVLLSICATIDYVTRMYDREPMTPKLSDEVNNRLECLLFTCNKVDYAYVSKNTVTVWLMEYADSGEYAFTDMYKDTGLRLWQQLVEWNDPKTEEARRNVYSYIHNNFKYTDEIYTGGYT